jgi:hypothetical protein
MRGAGPLLSGTAVVFVSNGLPKRPMRSCSLPSRMLARKAPVTQRRRRWLSRPQCRVVGLDEILIREAVHRETFDRVYANFLLARIALTTLSIVA